MHGVTTKVKSLIRVRNPHDEWCMIRAYVIGRAYIRYHVLEELNDEEFIQMCREGSVEQTRQTLELLDGTGLPRTGGHNLDDLKKLQEHLHTMARHLAAGTV